MRWMAEISYRNGRAPLVKQFEEIVDLHDIVEAGPDWNEIDQIGRHVEPFVRRSIASRSDRQLRFLPGAL
jgi:hypothetical protein